MSEKKTVRHVIVSGNISVAGQMSFLRWLALMLIFLKMTGSATISWAWVVVVLSVEILIGTANNYVNMKHMEDSGE